MILTLLVLPILAVSANPFHKYPYVFLLDVGNEELEKVNTEQIRLSSPGGSVALRYPAIGNGDDIAHIRVSGIDFGTDLKANIVDGGPGYKYVVIVLMGNPGVAYDAVLTVQTVPNIVTDDSIQNIEENSSSKNEDGLFSYRESEEDKNDSSENFNDSAESGEINKVQINENNGELTQESSNVYSYTQNEALSGYGIENKSDEENSDNDGDSDESYNEQADDFQSYNEDQSNGENLEIENHDLSEEDSSPNQPSAEIYASNDGNSQSDSQPIVVDQNLYDKYVALKDHLYNSVKVYPQGSIQENSNFGADRNYDYRPVDIENVYEDYEENDSAEYRDPNNNYLDTDDASSVAY